MKFIRLIFDYLRIRRSGYFDPIFYLINNEDVRRADLDPLWHYVRYGWKEGRNPSLDFPLANYELSNLILINKNPIIYFLDSQKKYRGLPLNNSIINEDINYEDKQTTIGNVGKVEFFSSDFEKVKLIFDSYNHFSNLIMAISHDNFIENIGGVQSVLNFEKQGLIKAGFDQLHIFPKIPIDRIGKVDNNLIVGINFNGKFLGYIYFAELEQLLNKSGKLKRIVIHHTLGFNLREIERLLPFSKEIPIYWIHDYYAICESYHLIKGTMEHCGAPPLDSNACMICKYGDSRVPHYIEFNTFFESNKLIFVTPSSFTFENWKKKSNFLVESGIVIPLINLEPDNRTVKFNKNEIRIGFPGFPMQQKGWKTWLRLVSQVVPKRNYRFFHFSFVEGVPGNYTRVFVKPTLENLFPMKEKLMENQIEVALLWSTVPETYCISMFEAIAAGCFIITNNESGNVKDFIEANPEHGVVLANEDELLYIFNNEMVYELLSKRNPKYFNLKGIEVDYLL